MYIPCSQLRFVVYSLQFMDNFKNCMSPLILLFFSFKMIFGVVRKEFYVASVEVPKILRKMLKCWASAEVV